MDDPNRGASVITDVQNGLCAKGGWTEGPGLDHGGCREAMPGVRKAVGGARGHGMWIIWVYRHNRHCVLAESGPGSISRIQAKSV